MAGVKRWKHPTKITGTQSPHPLYNCWRSIKRRCQIPADVAWKWYGARGITICKEWNESYDMFAEWAISVGYNIDKETRQIDRIDSNGNYEPSNCRFVDNSTNQANKRVYGKAIYRGISVIASYTRYKITQKSIKKSFSNTVDAAIFWDSICWQCERSSERLNFPDRIHEYELFDMTPYKDYLI